ncbi:MAG: hypothetical protein M0Z75_13680 [Nitrospiraceae bacterium]|nr:hypothetical protein [Nitrospiraceae bacterium]
MEIKETTREVMCIDGDVAIRLNIDYVNNTINLRPGVHDWDHFKFIHSDPALARKVIAVMAKAVGYAMNELKKLGTKNSGRSCRKCYHSNPRDAAVLCSHPCWPSGAKLIDEEIADIGCSEFVNRPGAAGMGELGDTDEG